MSIVPEVLAMHKPTVHYARIASLEGYRVETPCGTRFVDHDGHVYALTPDQAHALTLLGVERAHVLAALAGCEEV